MSGHSMGEQPDALAFDSTQTIRAVTVRELRDPRQQKWFAVQLAVCDRPVNVETMPRFEVFGAHSLYAVQGRLGTNACYALRLGFFTEQQAAQAVCTDLQAFYRSASVVRISEAEHARFNRVPSAEAPTQKPSQPSASKPVASANNIAAFTPAAAPRKPTPAAQGRNKFKSLSQELWEEARQMELARTGRQVKQRPASWLSRLLGR